VAHLPELASQAQRVTGLPHSVVHGVLRRPDYRLSYPAPRRLTEFFRGLVRAGRVPDGSLAFLPAA
jgi:chorismate dehydratase